MEALTVDDRILGWTLGLGDLAAPRQCWGYATCCNCADCLERERQAAEGPKPPPEHFPWEFEAA